MQNNSKFEKSLSSHSKLGNYRSIVLSTTLRQKLKDLLLLQRKLMQQGIKNLFLNESQSLSLINNLPRIQSRNNNMIPSFSKRSSKGKIKIRKGMNKSQQNCSSTCVNTKTVSSNNAELNETPTCDYKSKIERANSGEQNKQMYSVVDLLKLPTMANDYITAKSIKPKERYKQQLKSSYKLIPKNKLFLHKNVKHTHQKLLIEDKKVYKNQNSISHL